MSNPVVDATLRAVWTSGYASGQYLSVLVIIPIVRYTKQWKL